MTFYAAPASLDDLPPGRLGILEPDTQKQAIVEPSEIDLFIIPGVGFDPYGNRLGQGGGYYDRYLSAVPADIPRIGIAFDRQIVPYIESGPKDQGVTKVLSESTTYQFQMIEWKTRSVEETRNFAEMIAKQLAPPVVVRIVGELGAGKTEWVRGYLKACGHSQRVRSPTFNLEHLYDGPGGSRIYHLDGYRLDSPSQLDLDRLAEIIEDPNGIVLIEWAERFGERIGPFNPLMSIEHLGEERRRISWSAYQVGHQIRLLP